MEDEVLKIKKKMIDEINQDDDTIKKRTNGRSCQTSPVRIREDDNSVEYENTEV